MAYSLSIESKFMKAQYSHKILNKQSSPYKLQKPCKDIPNHSY